MVFTLKANGVKYSPSEQRLFALLPKSGRQSRDSAQLAAAFYKGRKPPQHARTTVVGAMRSLARKMAKNKEPLRVQIGKRQGPHPIDFWLVEAP